ncbi:hypothetical protein Pan241w_08230 [Gimesia alba]|uniref:Uncharacterized protein n=1 Tax=Gimesia alba TaxID=2527973 RepID=A0A517RA37_9PLAN|nr:hypothetical protein [Gimesia alba]QDT40764.1 hypothetical protein Pan241w_08230 [Gimesia alba]
MSFLEAFLLFAIFCVLYQQREIRRRLKKQQREIDQLKGSPNFDSQPES